MRTMRTRLGRTQRSGTRTRTRFLEGGWPKKAVYAYEYRSFLAHETSRRRSWSQDDRQTANTTQTPIEHE